MMVGTAMAVEIAMVETVMMERWSKKTKLVPKPNGPPHSHGSP